MRFLVGIAKLGTDLHVRCFEDHMRSMAAALRDLGHDVEYATEEALRKRPGRLILWGSNHVTEDPQASAERMEKIPTDAIVFQTEQVSAVDKPTYFIRNWIQYRDFAVWDYAQSNVDALKQLGMAGVVLCPLGYHPSMTKIERIEDQDIDVLFFGTRGGPRQEILNALDATGMNVVQLFGVYGDERDARIARAKIVINLHFYARGVFEIFRCAHLFANHVCVVNEAGGRDAGLEDLARRCTAYTPRSELVERCQELVASPHKRLAIAEQGFEEFKKLSLVENVRRALDATASVE
jgi:hypothetical protein